MNYKKELDLLKIEIKRIYNQTKNQEILTKSKGEQDIVTSMDLYIEEEIIKAIKKEFPNDFFHTEEFHHETIIKNRTWVIDPIDGTSNYAKNLGLFVVQIALYDQSDIVLSYVYAPELDKTYYAIKGNGAYLNDHPYHVNDHHSSTFMISMVGLSHKKEDKIYYKKIIDYSIEHKYKLRMLGSVGLEIALTSEGIFDLFYTNVTNHWDLYPGILLLREAGAILLNEQGKVYQLDDLNLFACKNEEVKDKLLKIL